MSVKSFKEKHLTAVPGRDEYRYNIHAWVNIDGYALYRCKGEEGGKGFIRSTIREMESRVKKLIAADLKELEKEKKK